MITLRELKALPREELVRIEADVKKAESERVKSLFRSIKRLQAEGHEVIINGSRVSAPRKQERQYKEQVFVNPHDKSDTWNGRGRRPHWLRDILAKYPEGQHKEVLAKYAA